MTAKKSNCAYGRRLWLMLAAMCHVGLKSFRLLRFKQRTARAHTEIISYIYKVHHAMDSLFSLALYGKVYHVSQLRCEMWTN